MKRVSIIVAAAILIGAVAFSAGTDLLIWNVDLAGNEKVEGAPFDSISKFYLKSTQTGQTFSLANYTYMDSDLSTSAGEGFSAGIFIPEDSFTDPYYTDLGSLYNAMATALDVDVSDINSSEWEFYMQLDNNGQMVAWSEHMFDPTKSNAASVYLSDVAGSVYNTSHPLSGNALPPAFNFGSHLVPEPTSGMLMMLGAGLLALRRRRA
jgi:hypothetical protein